MWLEIDLKNLAAHLFKEHIPVALGKHTQTLQRIDLLESILCIKGHL